MFFRKVFIIHFKTFSKHIFEISQLCYIFNFKSSFLLGSLDNFFIRQDALHVKPFNPIARKLYFFSLCDKYHPLLGGGGGAVFKKKFFFKK